MDGSADGLPLLSQDEFFRHLNLQSVHASSAKYHYRQALKERLRASKVAVRGGNGVSVVKGGNGISISQASEAKNTLTNGSHVNGDISPLLNGNSDKLEHVVISPPLSPYKWLSPHTCRRLFGRPRIKVERPTLNYKFESFNTKSNFNDEEMPKLLDKDVGSKNKNFSILQPLMKNYHVLRHPAIQKEVEERAAAEARLLSDETCNPLENKSKKMENIEGEASNDGTSILCDKASSHAVAKIDQTDKNVINMEDSTLNKSGEGIDSTTHENSTVTNSDDSSNQTPNDRTTNSVSPNRFLPTGSIEVRKCYLPENMRPSATTAHEKVSEKIVADLCHMKCFRNQPGKSGAARLEKQEKVRKLATLALFGHTFHRPEIAGVRPHAVAVNGYRKYHLNYSSLKSISKKNRKSKFPRICLSGQTASELLARSPQCTESSDDSADEYCSNNNTQKMVPRASKVNSHNIKSPNSKSLISSLSKSKKASPKKEDNDDDEFQCHYCDRSFTTKSGLGWHESYAHPRDCRVCSKSFQFSNRWSRHKDPICNPCSEKYPQPKNSPIKLTPTLSQNYNPNQLTEKQRLYYRFKCDICNKLFGKRSRMINHITNAHPSDMHKVDLAKFVFSPKKVSNGGNSLGNRIMEQ